MPIKENNQYFIDPVYGDTSRKTSGTSMEVVLGPDAIKSENYGSSTNSNSIKSHMEKLNAKDFTLTSAGAQKGLWVAGHLLNDNLGGSGVAGKNLTPLTQTANKQHSGYESRIKTALETSAQLERYANLPFIVGVKYKVTVSIPTFGDFTPYNKAPSSIAIKTELVKADKATDQITILSMEDMGHIGAGPLGFLRNAVFAETIDNDDDHLRGCKNPSCAHVLN